MRAEEARRERESSLEAAVTMGVEQPESTMGAERTEEMGGIGEEEERDELDDGVPLPARQALLLPLYEGQRRQSELRW